MQTFGIRFQPILLQFRFAALLIPLSFSAVHMLQAQTKGGSRGIEPGQVQSALDLTKDLRLSDFTYKKDVVPDKNLSPLIETLLNDPLQAFDFMHHLKSWAGNPGLRYESVHLRNPSAGCRVYDWKNTPESMRRELQHLFDEAALFQKRMEILLSGPSDELKKQALSSVAVDFFQLDRDLVRFDRWAARTASQKWLETTLTRADDLDLGETELILPQLEAGAGIKPAELEKDGRRLLGAIHQFVHAQKSLPPDPVFKFGVIKLETSIGPVWLADAGDHLHDHRNPQDAPIILVDLGGNDRHYETSVANGMKNRPLAISIDCGGDDTYLEGASGWWGAGILWDASGTDTYEGTQASLGCGIFGMGLLIDETGNDRYAGDIFSQGVGWFGYGLMRDVEGNDHYEAALMGQGLGGVNGIGCLSDLSGNDRYQMGRVYPDDDRYPEQSLSMGQGVGLGYRPFAPGGLGILYDRQGDDQYWSDVYGQGVGYWYGCGVLIDDAGSDSYRVFQYGQGSGIHLAVGLLKDGSGDDRYQAAKGLAQGAGHDLGFGLLWESGGNDQYRAEMGSQGSGIYNGIGMLFEAAGDDDFEITGGDTLPAEEIKGQGNGEGNDRRGAGSLGLLLDYAGTDRFNSNPGGTDVRVRPEVGFLMDQKAGHGGGSEGHWNYRRNASRTGIPLSRAATSDDAAGLFGLLRGDFAFGGLASTEVAMPPRALEEILKKGGDREWKRKQKEENRAKLESLPLEDFPKILPWLGRADVAARGVMEGVLDAKGAAARPVLREATQSDWYEIANLGIYLLGKHGEREDAALILTALQHERTRSSALVALSKIGISREDTEKVLPCLESEKMWERAMAARILMKLEVRPREHLRPLINDPHWWVREEVKSLLASPPGIPASAQE
jgi:hypothetical protein